LRFWIEQSRKEFINEEVSVSTLLEILDMSTLPVSRYDLFQPFLRFWGNRIPPPLTKNPFQPFLRFWKVVD
jgi:hypothetical protein